jgi:exosortase/archaeosortase family protein
MWVSAFFVRIPPSHLFRNRNWPGILPSFLIADSLVIVKQLYESTWPYFGVASAQTICSVLHQLDSQAVCRWANPKALALMHPQINVLIGPPCSGVDVFFLFLIASCVYLVVDTERPSFWFGAGILIGGVATAFLLNVVRVVSIFTLSLLANRVFGSATLGMDIFVGFFHAHAGWVIYTLGCIGYFSCIPYLRQRHFFVALRHNLNV